jgi:hypothetical protein
VRSGTAPAISAELRVCVVTEETNAHTIGAFTHIEASAEQLASATNRRQLHTAWRKLHRSENRKFLITPSSSVLLSSVDYAMPSRVAEEASRWEMARKSTFFAFSRRACCRDEFTLARCVVKLLLLIRCSVEERYARRSFARDVWPISPKLTPRVCF